MIKNSWATKQIMPSILFTYYDNNLISIEESLKKLSSEKLLRYVENV